MNFEGEGEIKIGGEDYNIKVIVSKKESPKQNGLVKKVFEFLKTFSVVKVGEESNDEVNNDIVTNQINKFILEKIEEYVDDKPTKQMVMLIHNAIKKSISK